MARFKLKRALKKHKIPLFVLLFAIAGASLLLIIRAAGPTASIEAENGTVTLPAVKTSDGTASGGSHVQFKKAGTSSGPACTATVTAPSSINSAASGLNAGAVLCLSGTFTNQTVTIGRSGTSTSRITIKSAPGQTAKIDGSGVARSKTQDIVLVSGSYVDFTGIEVINSVGRAISMTGQNSRVSNCLVHDIQYNGILDAGTNNIIEDNKVWRTVLSNTNAVLGGSGWAEAINTFRSTNTIIRNNEIYDSWGEGIDYINSNGGVAEGNLVYRNYSVQIYLDGSSNVTVRNNKLGANIAGANRAVTGVLVASEGGGGVSGNTVTGNYFTVTPYYSTWNVPASAVTFSNNFRCDANYANCVGL